MTDLPWRVVLSCGHELAVTDHLTGTLLCPACDTFASIIIAYSPGAIAQAERMPHWNANAVTEAITSTTRKDPPDEHQ